VSRVGHLLRAEARQLPRRNRPAILLIVALVSVGLVVQAVIGAGIVRFAESAQDRSALTLVMLSGVSSQATRDLTPATLAPLARMPDVKGVFPWWQHDLALSDARDWPDREVNPGALWATTLIPGLEPRILAGSRSGQLKSGEIILPAEVAGGSLRGLLGRTVNLEYTRVVAAGQGQPARIALRVVAIGDNSVPGQDGPQPAYLSLADMMLIDGGTQPAAFTAAYVQADSAAHVPGIQRTLAEEGFAVSSLAEHMRSLGGLFDVLRGVGWLLLAAMSVVCVLVGAAAGSAWVRHRRRDLGVLSAIGWTRSMITRAVVGELAVIGGVAGFSGAVLGAGLSLMGTTLVAQAELVLLPVSAWQLPPWGALVGVCVAVPLCVVVGGLPPALRAARLDPDDVIRGDD
jgi:putative ABC transport system permease protein